MSGVDLDSLRRRGLVSGSGPSVHYTEDEHRAVIAALARAERIEAATREMLLFGEHPGACTNPEDGDGTEPCLLHAEAFGRRRAALIAELESGR